MSTNNLVMIKPGQAVIFDMDGVIVDTEPLNERHMEQFLTELGVPEPHSFDSSLKGFNSKTIWIVYKQRYKLQQSVDELIGLSRQHYINFLGSLHETPIIPGAIELIQQLTKLGCPLAIGASASPKRIDLILRKLELKSCFKVIISGDDVVHGKPAPEVFLLAAKKLGVMAQECIIIEDSTNGVAAAKAAGAVCIAYGGSEHNTDDLSRADVIIDDFVAFSKSLQA